MANIHDEWPVGKTGLISRSEMWLRRLIVRNLSQSEPEVGHLVCERRLLLVYKVVNDRTRSLRQSIEQEDSHILLTEVQDLFDMRVGPFFVRFEF